MVIPQDGSRAGLQKVSTYTTESAGVLREHIDLRNFFPNGSISFLLCTIPASGSPLPFAYRVYVDNLRKPRALNRTIEEIFARPWIGNVVVVRYGRLSSQPKNCFVNVQRPEAELAVAILGE